MITKHLLHQYLEKLLQLEQTIEKEIDKKTLLPKDDEVSNIFKLLKKMTKEHQEKITQIKELIK